MEQSSQLHDILSEDLAYGLFAQKMVFCVRSLIVLSISLAFLVFSLDCDIILGFYRGTIFMQLALRMRFFATQCSTPPSTFDVASPSPSSDPPQSRADEVAPTTPQPSDAPPPPAAAPVAVDLDAEMQQQLFPPFQLAKWVAVCVFTFLLAQMTAMNVIVVAPTPGQGECALMGASLRRFSWTPESWRSTSTPSNETSVAGLDAPSFLVYQMQFASCVKKWHTYVKYRVNPFLFAAWEPTTDMRILLALNSLIFLVDLLVVFLLSTRGSAFIRTAWQRESRCRGVEYFPAAADLDTVINPDKSVLTTMMPPSVATFTAAHTTQRAEGDVSIALLPSFVLAEAPEVAVCERRAGPCASSTPGEGQPAEVKSDVDLGKMAVASPNSDSVGHGDVERMDSDIEVYTVLARQPVGCRLWCRALPRRVVGVARRVFRAVFTGWHWQLIRWVPAAPTGPMPA